VDGRSEPPLLRPVWLLAHQDLRGSTRVKLVSAAIVDAFRRNAKILRDGQLNLPSSTTPTPTN
jgi:hypothetical protein